MADGRADKGVGSIREDVYARESKAADFLLGFSFILFLVVVTLFLSAFQPFLAYGTLFGLCALFIGYAVVKRRYYLWIGVLSFFAAVLIIFGACVAVLSGL